MDAGNLDQERIDACSFMVMTADGPVSMCAHNARRDEYILKPITVTRRDGTIINFKPLVPHHWPEHTSKNEVIQRN